MSTLDEIKKYAGKLSSSNTSNNVDTMSEIRKYASKLSAYKPDDIQRGAVTTGTNVFNVQAYKDDNKPKAQAAIVKPTTGVMSARERYRPQVPDVSPTKMYNDHAQKVAQNLLGTGDALTAKAISGITKPDTELDKWTKDTSKAITDEMLFGDKGIWDKLTKVAELTDIDKAERMAMNTPGVGNLKTSVQDELAAAKAALPDNISEDWIEYARQANERKSYEKSVEEAKQLAKDKPGAASALSIATNAMAGAGMIDTVGKKIGRKMTGSDAPINFQSPAMMPSAATEEIRGTVSESMSPFWSKVYNQGMSMADSAVAIATTALGIPGYNYILGAAGATSTMRDAKARGATDEQAIALGLISGLAESFFEKHSIDTLFSSDAGRTFGKFVLDQAASEGYEEGATFLANTLADLVIAGDKSELSTMQREFMKNGMSEKDANTAAGVQWLKNLGANVLGGAISGGVFGTFGAAARSIAPDSRIQEMKQAAKDFKPTVDSVMPQVQQGTDTTPSMQDQRVEAAEAEPTVQTEPAVQQTPIANAAEHRETAAQILNEGIFESPVYGDALEQTGMKRSDVRQALRKIASNSPAAAADAEVQAVINAIVQAETEPQAQMETQMPVDAEMSEDVEAKPAMGAADYGFSPYSNYQNTQSQFIPEGANAARPVDVPATDPTGKKTRSFLNNAMGAKSVPERGVDRMQDDFMEGRYGYEVKGDKKAVRKANQLVKEKSFDFALAQTVERLQTMKNLKQTVVDAEVLIAKAYKEGRDAEAAELCLLLAETGTEFGQAVQAYSIFRKLTPEGQIEGIKRTVQRLNEKIAEKGGKKKKVSDADQQYIVEYMDKVRETMLQALAGDQDAIDNLFNDSTNTAAQKKRGRDHGLEVENWMTEVGRMVAKALDAKPKAQEPKPISRIIRQDILNLAKKHWPQAPKAKAAKRTAADTITDFFANREQYVKAWNAALEEYRTTHGLGEDFIGPAGTGAEPMMIQAIVDEATAQELKKNKIELFSYLGDRASIEKQLADGLIKRTHATGSDADTIRRAVSQYVSGVLYDANVQRISNGLDKDIKKVVQEIGGNMYDIVRENKGNKAGAAKIVANMMVKQYGISKDAAQAASVKIVDRFNTIIAEQTKRALDTVFADRKKPEAKSAVQKTTELGNMGAFDSETYKDKAAAKATQYVDADIKKAVKAIGKDAAEIIRSSTADKTETAKRIQDMLMDKHRLHEADAKKMGDFITDRFNQMVAEKSQAALENMFKERDKKVPKTFEKKFAELANMGAFTNSDFIERATEKLFGEGITLDQDLVNKFLAAPDEESRNAVMDEIYADIGQKMPTTAGEIANQWRYTAMLLNPSTHIKNIAGNATQAVETSIKDTLATVGEMGVDAVSKLVRDGKGIDRTKAFLNRRNKDDLHLLEIAKADYENVVDEIQGTGKYKNTAEGKINEHRDIMKLNDPQTKVAKAVDAVLRKAGDAAEKNSELMDKEDRCFSQRRYAKALASYMKANGQTEITDEARKYAIKEAQKATYRDVNAVSDFARSMGHSKYKLVNFVVNSIFPFKATPANVGVRAVEYSPVGLLTTIGKAYKAKRNGEFKAADFIDDLSANITGSALVAVGALLAKSGILRAKGTGDKKEKEQDKREGYKQNSVNVFGYSVPITAIGAGSIPLLLGSAIYENFIADNPDEEDGSFDSFLDALAGTLDPVAETTMLSGLQDALRSFQDYNPDAGIAKQFAVGFIDVAGNYIASFIPSLMSRVANATDTAARQVYVDKNKDLQKLQSETQEWQKKIPGLRNQLTAQIDAYGNEVSGGMPTEGNLLEQVMKGIGNVVTPIYPSKIQTTEVDEELRRIYDETTLDKGNMAVFTTDAPKSFEVDGEVVYLTGKQYEQFAKTRNSSIQRIQSDVMDNEMYAEMSVEVQHRAMHDAKAYAEALAKAELGVGYQLPDKWMRELAGASPEVVAQTILERSVTNEADSNRYENKYLGLETMLDNGSIDDQLALACMSNSANEAYMNICKDAGISVQQFLDAYGHASLGGDKASDKKQAALDYIDTLDLDAKTASKLALAVHTAIGTVYTAETKLPDDYLLDIGATEQYEAQMSKTQKEGYDAYIKGSKMDLKLYQSVWDFKNSDAAKGEKDAKGKDIKGKSHQDKVVDFISGLKCSDKQKGILFLSMGWAKKNMPNEWK